MSDKKSDHSICEDLEEVKKMIATAKTWGLRIVLAIITSSGGVGVYALGRLDKQDEKIQTNKTDIAVSASKQESIHKDVREIRDLLIKKP